MGTAFILRTCDKDMKSHDGFQWPASGEVVAPDFEPTKECGCGLHGILWGIGECSLMQTSNKDAVWLVAEVDDSTLIDLGGKVKFPRANVVYAGKMPGAFQLIAEKRLIYLAEKAEKSSGRSSPVASSGRSSPVASSGRSSPVASSGRSSPAKALGELSAAC